MSVDEILEAVEGLTVLELNELVEKAEGEFGASAVAPIAVAGGAPAAGGAPTEERSESDVILASAGEAKMKVIKTVKDLTGLELEDVKALVDEAPKVVKEGASKEEAKELKAKLGEVGATIELK